MLSSSLERLVNDVHSWATSFGADDGENCISRNNLINLTFEEGHAYFGFVRPEEGQTGQFSDFSYVIFPVTGEDACLAGLGVGTLAFKNDYELALRKRISWSTKRWWAHGGETEAMP